MTHDAEEAFAVADRMALMRAGRLVQTGTVDEVWRDPVDAEAARFLGYATVLDGEPARVVLAAGGRRPAGRLDGALALRRSALRVDPAGGLRGRVRTARATPDAVRLEVDVDGVGPVDAVGAVGEALPGPGQDVCLVVDLTRTARLPPAGST